MAPPRNDRNWLTRQFARRTAGAAALADQFVSSLTNFAMVLVAARLLDETGFGSFSAVYLVYVIVIGVVQAVIAQELVLLNHGEIGKWIAVKSALIFAALSSFALAALLALTAALLLDTGYGPALFSLAATIPFLVVQETLRATSSFLRAPQLALVGDLAWLGLLSGAIATILLANGEFSSGSLVLTWGATGAISAIPMVIAIARPISRSRSLPRRYLSKQFIGHRFNAEYLMVSAVQNVAVLVVGAFSSPAAIGALRGITTLFSPVRVLLDATAAFGIPMIKDLQESARLRALLALAAAFAAVSGLGLITLTVLPSSLGQLIMGDTWDNLSLLVLPTGLQFIAMSFSRMAYVALRIRMPRSTFSLRVIASISYVALFFTGFVLWGVVGAAWGAFAASVFQALNAWGRYALVSLREKRT